jgi:hypothetical protein
LKLMDLITVLAEVVALGNSSSNKIYGVLEFE